ncbi:phosphodiester glycosidase family protein [Paenibacillus sp. MWE-103]|uniref:Phosphodiester glycosidase family protein n=1 Tax=Paenibacillus artemisiicola TaxID=1172618 RepID=A0ABS3WI33_9BACL|nr:phosphodiester glycosidase family protein [Paenibacillus artemisiicola]MBO7747991.1 phosphodiester glycosidase family protein [Paenibacillus artemisiicola]
MDTQTQAPFEPHYKSKRYKKLGKPKRWRKRLSLLFAGLLVAMLGGAGWFYLTPSGSDMRYMMADTLITSQHRYLAKYLIGQSELDRRVAEYAKKFDEMGQIKDEHNVDLAAHPDSDVQLERISTAKYKGYIMYVHDPKMIRVATTSIVGSGETVLSMVKRTGAIAGVNGGAFDDPNWDGNGFKPAGIVMSGGKVLYKGDGMQASVNVVGIDRDGLMVAGRYKPSQLLEMGVRDAVTFQPKFIVNGKGLIKNEADGWGIAPRTVMAQQKDGTIMFVVIDGRQPGYSVGATLYDIQKLLLARGAVTAANLDGGSSTVLVKDDAVVNKPSSQYGMRYLPSAFLVFDHPEAFDAGNIWSGIDMEHFDSSKPRTQSAS